MNDDEDDWLDRFLEVLVLVSFRPVVMLIHVLAALGIIAIILVL